MEMSHTGVEIRIDRDRCMGSGNCVFWAPDTFSLDDDGRPAVVSNAIADLKKIMLAVEGCPVQAISVMSQGDGLTVQPS